MNQGSHLLYFGQVASGLVENGHSASLYVASNNKPPSGLAPGVKVVRYKVRHINIPSLHKKQNQIDTINSQAQEFLLFYINKIMDTLKFFVIPINQNILIIFFFRFSQGIGREALFYQPRNCGYKSKRVACQEQNGMDKCHDRDAGKCNKYVRNVLLYWIGLFEH